MAIKSFIKVIITQKEFKGQSRVDVAPIDSKEDMNEFFKQFVGKKVKISVEDLLVNCDNQICKKLGECQGHWTEDELNEKEKK